MKHRTAEACLNQGWICARRDEDQTDALEREEGTQSKGWSREVYGTAVVSTLGLCSTWIFFRDPIEDLFYGGYTFPLFRKLYCLFSRRYVFRIESNGR